jgi:RHH-type proline utilization regulon transcriptional repressor/proline dehydrogenase/delta 1-pyrroline-5-carboxylate dehydrogenase
MLVDSTALPEQAVRDVVASAFQSAGQRCSALRILYVQDDVAERVLEMLRGAMAQLRVGDPWVLSTDVGPVIDIDARERIEAHCERLTADGRLLARLDPPAEGCFVPPTILRVSGIEELEEEVFGPVLHVASFPAEGVGAVIEAINARGYGLTFGLHTRIDDRVQQVVEQIRVGNVYVNRNQIGAVVGSQPFGGEGLSGTGPKAGGPHYLPRFTRRAAPRGGALASASISAAELQCALDALRDAARADAAPSVEHLTRLLGELGASACESRPEPLELAGPTGESNRLSLHPRGVVLCLGPGRDAALAQAAQALVVGNAVVVADPQAVADAGRLARAGAPVAVLRGPPEPRALSSVRGFDAVACVADTAALRTLRIALAARDGPLVPLITESGTALRYALERHVCVDTTAAGGNASLLAAVQG